MKDKNLNTYIHGVIYGIKTSIKLIARIKDIKKVINLLCDIEKGLINRNFNDIDAIWLYVEKKDRPI